MVFLSFFWWHLVLEREVMFSYNVGMSFYNFPLFAGA